MLNQSLNMSKTILQISSVSSSSSNDTDSTQTQSDALPPIRNCCTFDHLPKNHQLNESDVNRVAGQLTYPFRKCKSFVQLDTGTGKLKNSLIVSDYCGNCDYSHRAASAPSTVYMAIKLDHQFSIQRIFSRCKVKKKNRKNFI